MAESKLIIFDKGRRTALDDAELVAALRAHDERAYTVAWVELGLMVRRLVTRFFGAGADTPDLSQEVFLRLFRRIGELRNPSGLRGFVVSICLGVARNELRRVRVRRWVRLTSTGLRRPSGTRLALDSLVGAVLVFIVDPFKIST